MRAAEHDAAAAGLSLGHQMDRAGAALGDLARRVAGGRPIVVLVGPGNNGGDGYVAARWLRDCGETVSILAGAPPSVDLARAAAAAWGGPVGQLDATPTAEAVVVDCLFGTGLNRPLDPALATALARHAGAAARTIAADLPSGVDADTGRLLGCPYRADVTLAFGALKPAHRLFPAADHSGEVLVADLGQNCASEMCELENPQLCSPSAASHKYSRGMVAVVAGRMSGAAELAARGALRSGAGYVTLIGSSAPPTPPFTIVRRSWRAASLNDVRIGAVVIGCGFGDGEAAIERMAAALASGKPMVIDAGGLSLLPDGGLTSPAILTPHSGEFSRMGGVQSGGKIAGTLDMARARRAVIVHKGADTVIAAPDGRVGVSAPGSAWLATAGTGDVLAGICGAMLARGFEPFAAACAAVWLHQRAAVRAGPGMIADDLVARPIWP